MCWPEPSDFAWPAGDLPAEQGAGADADPAGRCYGFGASPGRGLPSGRTRHAGFSHFVRRDPFGHPGG